MQSEVSGPRIWYAARVTTRPPSHYHGGGFTVLLFVPSLFSGKEGVCHLWPNGLGRTSVHCSEPEHESGWWLIWACKFGAKIKVVCLFQRALRMCDTGAVHWPYIPGRADKGSQSGSRGRPKPTL